MAQFSFPIRLNRRTIKAKLLFFILCLFAPLRFGYTLLAQTPDTAAPDFFIEAEIDNPTPYLGQQVTYVVRRYQATEFPNQPHYEDHPFAGFWDTPLIQRPSYTTTLNGRDYLVHPTYLALFPTRPGPLTIEPARLIIPGDGPEQDTVLESEAIQVEVKPLPPDAPTYFNGAVGQFEISANFDRPTGQVDQLLTLIVEIEGYGNIAALNSPIIPTLPNWRLLGQLSLPEAEIPLSKDKAQGKRRFEWPVAPAEPGQQFFPPITFSYFDPESASYQTIRTDSIGVVIAPVEESTIFTSPPLILKQEVKRLSSDIRHIKPVPANLEIDERASPSSWWVWGCLALPILAVSGAWFWQRWQTERLADTPQARRRRARQRAKKALAQPTADTYGLIREVLLDYLSAKLGQPVAGLTSDRLAVLLAKAQIDPQLIGRVQSLLERAEAGRFAPLTDEASLVHSLPAGARVLIDDLEEAFS
jgi:hypothetical protein